MKPAAVAFLVYSALTVVLTYPLVLQLGSVLPNDAGDPALNTWILWWNAQAIPYTSNWWNAPAFYPVPGVLAFSENLLGLSLISTPVQWLGGSPQVAYNIVFLLTFPLSALGAYLLALHITKRDDAAFIAGLLFGFAPYRIAHLPQIQALAAFPMPFALLGLHRYLRDPRPRWLALFGAGWLLQGISNGYYLLFFSVLVGMWMLWFASRPQTFAAILVAWFIAAIPMLPILWQYQIIQERLGFTREVHTIRDFSADVAGLMYATSTLAFWKSMDVYKRAEGELFPGLTIVLLIIAGALFLREPKKPIETTKNEKRRTNNERGSLCGWRLARRVLLLLAIVTAAIAVSAVVIGPWAFSPFGVGLLSVANPIKPFTILLLLLMALAVRSPSLRRACAARSALGFYALAAFVMWLLSLGPFPTLMGKPLMYRGPYSLLMFFPGFNALRVPARFWMMAILCLAIVGAILFDRLAARAGRTLRLVAATIVALGVIADGWVSDMPLAAAPPVWRAESCGNGTATSRALVELPLGYPYGDVAAMYRSMSHGRPVVNGYSGYSPPHYAALRFGLSLRDPDTLTQLAIHGAADFVIDRQEDPDGSWERYVAAHPGAQVICTEGTQALYRLTADPSDVNAKDIDDKRALPVAAIRPSLNSDVAGQMIDGDRTTRWDTAAPQTAGTVVDLDLGGVRAVNRVELALGAFVEDFPRGMTIEASQDGLTWREVWHGGSAGRAFAGALEAPRDVLLTYEFPLTPARSLRLRLTAGDNTYYWSIAELKVLGP